MRMKLILLLALLGSVSSVVSAADHPGDQDPLTVIGDWYAELAKRDQGRPFRLTAPGFIDASPSVDYVDTGAAVLGPAIYTSLAARALEFDYDVASVRLDANFAKVRVWEKGYFYAFAAQSTYELGASTLFVLEREEMSGRWLILAHETTSVGISPTLQTDPLPDMRKAWEERRKQDPMANFVAE